MYDLVIGVENVCRYEFVRVVFLMMWQFCKSIKHIS